MRRFIAVRTFPPSFASCRLPRTLGTHAVVNTVKANSISSPFTPLPEQNEASTSSKHQLQKVCVPRSVHALTRATETHTRTSSVTQECRTKTALLPRKSHNGGGDVAGSISVTACFTVAPGQRIMWGDHLRNSTRSELSTNYFLLTGSLIYVIRPWFHLPKASLICESELLRERINFQSTKQ